MRLAQTVAGCCWVGGQDSEEAGLRMSSGEREDSQSWSQSALVRQPECVPPQSDQLKPVSHQTSLESRLYLVESCDDSSGVRTEGHSGHGW